MKVTSILNGDEWVFSVATEPAEEELSEKRRVKIHNRSFMLKVSENFNREEIHKTQLEKVAEPMSQAEVDFLESWDVR
jgi:hypothetical protein